MELNSQLKGLAEKVENLKKHIDTEESTKHAFVLPFINILGFDTFNPIEVVPEFTADLGLKKGEKVDYAIFQNGEPILIIECKHWNSELNVHNSSQLFRYFHTTKTRFSLLTNGITYKFYTDLVVTSPLKTGAFKSREFSNELLILNGRNIHEKIKVYRSANRLCHQAGRDRYTGRGSVPQNGNQ